MSKKVLFAIIASLIVFPAVTVNSSIQPNEPALDARNPAIEPATVAYQEMQAQQPMRSRKIIEEGIQVEVEGMLRKMGGGWYIAVDQVLHQLFMAPDDFRQKTGFSPQEGKQAKVTGFFYAEEGEMTGNIAISTITVDGKEYRFREDDGTPLWRGRGSGGSPRQMD